MALAGTVFGALVATAAMAQAPAEPPQAAPVPRIAVHAVRDREWRVEYRFDAPVRVLAFARSPDDSRARTWTPPPDVEIVATSSGEIARRRDGQPFSTLAFGIPARYADLPSDYAPFAPFGDGSMLFHTGRLFACAGECADDAAWRMELDTRGWRHVLVDGRYLDAHARWTDRGDGRGVYLGETRPLRAEHVVAVLDRALPGTIRAQLLAQLPSFMRHFATRLGALEAAPMLFASYDAAHVGGWGRQGGTLPGQVFVHFYGARWAERMRAPDFATELAWHFAHEAAHLYQRQAFAPDAADAWIHEGGAEALAALAMRAEVPDDAAYVDARLRASATACAAALHGRPLHEALKGGEFQRAYDCGLVLNAALDRELRRAAPGADGLYGVWRGYVTDVAASGAGERTFLARVREAGGEALAERVRDAVHAADGDLSLSR